MKNKNTTPRPNKKKATKTTARAEWGDAKAVHAGFGIGKTTAYRLAAEGKIRTSSLRERGMKRGKRLFGMDSISAYIERMADGGKGEAE